MPTNPKPAPELLPMGPLNLINTKRSLIHIETSENHPAGQGIGIVSLNKRFAKYAELFCASPELLDECNDLKWQIKQAIATAKLRGLGMDEEAIPWWQQFTPSPVNAALLAALQGLLEDPNIAGWIEQARETAPDCHGDLFETVDAARFAIRDATK